MIFDLFNELQMPRPWGADHEHQVFENALVQSSLADELGYGCWWSVEHHCAPEFSYSSAPELMNAAIASRTERIRVGHSGVLTPFKINHPLRVAERAAVLDHLSNGRVELGLARSGGAEWTTFGIDGEGTLVTSYYDWSNIDPVWREAGIFPILSEGALRATLGILDRTVAPRNG